MMKKLLFYLFLILAVPIAGPPALRADIATNDSRDVYTGNGTTSVFSYTFKVLAETQIGVFINGVQQTLNTHYTVSGVNNDGGGAVTFTTAPTNGAQVLFLRNQPIEQITSYTAGPISASVLERDFDRQTAINQMQQEEIGRALRYPRTQSATAGQTILPTPV